MAEEMSPEWIYSRLIAMGMSPFEARMVMDAARNMPEVKKEPEEPVIGTTATGPLFWFKEFDVEIRVPKPRKHGLTELSALWDAYRSMFGVTFGGETVRPTSHEHIFATNDGVFVVPPKQD